jgi:outer membrane protein OmpA-like peptidoglycan-associated protein
LVAEHEDSDGSEKMNKRSVRVGASFTAVALTLAGCATDEYGNRLPMSDTTTGALVGTAVGAGIGALAASHSAKGALLGAVGGGLAGALVGNYMDRQKQDFEKVLAPELNAGVIRLEKLPDNRLRVGMTSVSAFQIDSYAIKPSFYGTLNRIAQVVNRYGKTQLVIVGYTDNTGSPQHNQVLSERRAGAVQNYLLGRGVIPQRLTAYGRGEADPIASNATEAGRQLNRRVEITIIPVTQG